MHPTPKTARRIHRGLPSPAPTGVELRLTAPRDLGQRGDAPPSTATGREEALRTHRPRQAPANHQGICYCISPGCLNGVISIREDLTHLSTMGKDGRSQRLHSKPGDRCNVRCVMGSPTTNVKSQDAVGTELCTGQASCSMEGASRTRLPAQPYSSVP